jgi:glycosyltransferase involved in cell wall biosynthesis
LRPFRARGVTYGSFAPRRDGRSFPEAAEIERDFSLIAARGLNTVRTYGLPPPETLAIARDRGLRLIVGLDYEDWRYHAPGRGARRRVLDAGRRAVAEAMELCALRPEVLAIAVGNEVPGDIARLHGVGAVEDTLSLLLHEVHEADALMLATYCNYPTTEYLCLEGQDVVCFNVFLERAEALRRYLRHLQIVSAELPLIITELGLAAGIHGEQAQAAALDWQLRAIDESGCAGATVYAWTDEWAVAGRSVEGWGFGVTDTQRRPKAALAVLERNARSKLHDLLAKWPRISVIVCCYNASGSIESCLSSLECLDYPDVEVLVVDDGSTDGTLGLARSYPFRVLALAHEGLGAARNSGVAHATGEIVAFLDADAMCHPEWAYHLALSMQEDHVAATGGPNLPVRGAGLVERAVSRAPGGPLHVLLTDDSAEHVPGCNLAVRKDALEEVGGFDPIHTAAGDDVDVCWKLLDRGYHISFSAAAQVRHHRRDTVAGYLRQQLTYGKAERVVSGRHRHRFNRFARARWTGFLYGGPSILPQLLRPVVYHGPAGLAPYQGIVRRRAEILHARVSASLPYLVPIVLLGGLVIPAAHAPLAAAIAALLLLLGYACMIAAAARPPIHEPHPIVWRLLVAWLHVVQPFARALGRLVARPAAPQIPPKVEWRGERALWLQQLRHDLMQQGSSVRVGRPHDDWDLEAWLGPFVALRLTTAVAWGWVPYRRLAYRLRPWAGVTGLVACAVTLFNPPIAETVLGFLVTTCVVETVALHRIAVRSLAITTTGAERHGEEPTRPLVAESAPPVFRAGS